VFRLPVERGLHRFVDERVALGTPGCDNCIARILNSAGHRPFNPCRSIVLVHEHDGWERAVYNSSNVCKAVRHLCVEPAHL
jgi:hypothetical protein